MREITENDVKQWLADRQLVAVPVGHLQCVSNQLQDVADANLAATKWVQGFLKSQDDDDD